MSGLAAVMADDAVRRAYLERTGQAPAAGQAAAHQAKQRPLDSDDCPVCFDALSVTVCPASRELGGVPARIEVGSVVWGDHRQWHACLLSSMPRGSTARAEVGCTWTAARLASAEQHRQ
jgi:hypothetical protein